MAFDLDLARTYFEELLFMPKYRLPEGEWTPSDGGNSRLGLTLTNVRIKLRDDSFWQIAFVPESGSSDDYLRNIDKYSGKAWMRLSIRNGASTQISIGDKPRYRFVGVAFFQIFVKQDVSAKETKTIHTDISKYVLFWKSLRKQETGTVLSSITVSPPSSSFGIDAVSDGWSQSNLSFPFTYDTTI